MYGAESEVKENGALTVQAFFAAEPGTYDAILMDIQMPEMDGYQAARAIRGGAGLDAEAVRAGAGAYAAARADAGTIPIIAMTANAFAEDIHAAMEAGMDAHIAKPIDIGILRETLKTALAD